MTKVNILALLAVVALFLTLPAVVFAQQVPPLSKTVTTGVP